MFPMLIWLTGMETPSHAVWPLLIVLLSFAGFRSADETQAASDPSDRIVLTPVQGEMICYADPPSLPGQRFALGVPETIGSRERMMALNFPEVKGKLQWTGPDSAGVVSTTWTTEGVIGYRMTLTPRTDHVDLEITVTNLTDEDWHDVFAFNCLNPVGAPLFKDWDMERTYMSMAQRPTRLSGTTHNPGRRPTIRIYLPEGMEEEAAHPFAEALEGISPDRTDGHWLATLSEPAGAYIGAVSKQAPFLFTNRDRCCLHAATDLADIPAGASGTARSRFFFARGGLEDFLQRVE